MEPQVELGNYWRRHGDLEAARFHYTSVLKNDKNHPDALEGIGVLKLPEGDKEAGLADVQRAYEQGEDKDYIRENLIIALIECGQREEAEDLLEEFDAEELYGDFLEYLNGDLTLYDYYVDS